jgi:hypothetical protein
VVHGRPCLLLACDRCGMLHAKVAPLLADDTIIVSCGRHFLWRYLRLFLLPLAPSSTSWMMTLGDGPLPLLAARRSWAASSLTVCWAAMLCCSSGVLLKVSVNA